MRNHYRECFSGLEDYLAHFEKYKGLSRKKLAKVDSGLHRKLSREGNLEKAIPEKKPSGRKPISEETIDKIKTFRLVYYQSSQKISKRLNISSNTVRKYLKEIGLKPLGKEFSV